MPSPAEKKAREVKLGEILAAELNRVLAGDYRVEPRDHELADVVLLSRLGLPTREVQITSAPMDPEAREDLGNIEVVQKGLRQELLTLGSSGIAVFLSLTPMATSRRMPRSLIGRLAEMIGRLPSVEYTRLEDICDSDLDLGEYVDSVGVIRLTGPVVEVTTTLATFAPRDGMWLREAAQKKVAKHGAVQTAKITLLIDALGFVDQEQIDSFRAQDAPNLPFAEIWTHSTFYGLCRHK